MYELLSVFTVSLGVGYIVYYLWHLTWPIVEGTVIDSYVHKMPSVVSSRRKYKIVNYQFEYGNETYSSNRLGLFMRFGFAPNVLKGESYN